MQDLSVFNGQDGAALSISGSLIANLEGDAQAQGLRIDLRGDRLLPGLINAHDHLQLNALPRLKFRDRHANVSQWILDIEPRLKADPLFIANGAVPREQRLLIGGIKNLLSGVCTVAHHDPLYASLHDEETFPVRVLRTCGWAHSLQLDGAQGTRDSYRQTPAQWPWIIHAGEGIDEMAAGEFERLEALDCIQANTVIVHGVALGEAAQRRLVEAGAGLVWCPSSNLHLFGRTLDIQVLLAARRLALGSDSRISGGLDLLAELRTARAVSGLAEDELESLVTDRAAELLRLPDRGRLQPGAMADVLVLPAGLPLSQASRADIRLLLIGGVPRYADPDYAEFFDGLVEVRVDGHRKYLARSLVQALNKSQLQEPGLDTLQNGRDEA